MVEDVWSLLGFVVASALIDSIDPCMYALYLAMLTPTIINIKRCIVIALTFISSVYIGYLLFNAILRLILLMTSPPRFILSLLLTLYALAIIIYTIFLEKNTNNVCRDDRPLCKAINKINMHIASIGIAGTAILGFIASFTVLPCSAGMAIAFNIVTRSLGLAMWIPLAIVYTAIFVLPLITLTLILVGLTKIKNFYETMLEKQRWIKIVGALLMISIALWLTIT